MRNLAYLMTLLFVLPATTSEAARRYRVRIKTTPPGASIYVGSKSQGVRQTTPARIILRRGANTIILELPGYEPLKKVLQIRRRGTYTFQLEKKIDKATIHVSLASGESTGTHVTVDGQSHGPLPAETTVTAGRHLVEVTKSKHQTWRQWVDVKAGERRAVSVNLVAMKAKIGAVLISSSAPGAEVFVDGKSAGASPALVEKMPVGPHTVEVRAKGHTPATRTVTVAAGKTARVTISLVAIKKAPTTGSIQVLSEPASVDVYIDGKLAGRAPVKVDALAAGTHHVEGRLTGHVKAEQQVSVTRGQISTIKLTLAAIKVKKPPVPVAVKPPVKAKTDDAPGTVFLDGAPLGALISVNGKAAVPLPPSGFKLEPGEHTFTLTYSGYTALTKKATVQAGTTLRLEAKMEKASAEDTSSDDGASSQPVEPEPKPVDTRGLSSFGAQLMTPGYFSADISGGFPYFVEGRLTTGVFTRGHFGLDAGIELKTNGAFTEFGAITKFRFLMFNPLAVAAFVAMGGGGGPGSRNNFAFNGGLLVSLMFKGLLTFTGRLYVNVYTDRLCPESAEDGELDVCSVVPDTTNLDQSPRDRFVGARFLMSALLEVPITRNLGIFLLFEGAPGQDARPSFTNAFFFLMPDADTRLYGRGGVSFKF